LEEWSVEEKRKREKMKLSSEAMRGWAEGLGREVEGWPGVTLKRAFGMSWVYRGEAVFAALPGTRAIHHEDAILMKFMNEPPAMTVRIQAEERFAAGTMERKRTTKGRPGREGHKWRIFLMRGDGDVHAAIEWLAEAYRVAGKVGRPGR
jgi:hypothetical protein